MAKTKEQQPSDSIPEGTTWEVELKRVGFIRRLFMARRWYGADWWFVAISAVGVFAFIIIAFFPGLFAPFSPDALVGPSFLAPGAHVDLPVLVVPATSPVHTLQDLAVPAGADRSTVAVIEGAPTGGALNEQSQKLDQVIKNQPGGLRLHDAGRGALDAHRHTAAIGQAAAGDTEVGVIGSGILDRIGIVERHVQHGMRAERVDLIQGLAGLGTGGLRRDVGRGGNDREDRLQQRERRHTRN